MPFPISIIPPLPCQSADVLSPEGLRQDGRRAGELRRLVLQAGVMSSPSIDGSALYQQGNTRRPLLRLRSLRTLRPPSHRLRHRARVRPPHRRAEHGGLRGVDAAG